MSTLTIQYPTTFASGNTFNSHQDYIAHLKELDTAYYAGLRALGFKRQNNLMVNRATGVVANRLGFADGYLVRCAPIGAPEAASSVHVTGVAEMEARVSEIGTYRP